MSARSLSCLLFNICLVAFLAGAPVVDASPFEARVTDPVPLLELRTAQSGWFWTLSQSEAASAVNQYGFTQQHSKLGFLRRQAFPGSQPIYRLRMATKSAYLLTPSESERNSLLASGNFVEGGVMGYAATTQLPGTQLLYRMANSAEWRMVPAALQATFTARGYRTDGPMGYVWPTYHRTGAIYFATFNPGGNQAMMAGTYAIYGRTNDWWGGLRDFAGVGVQRNAWHWPGEDFSDLQPSIGYYDDSQPETLRKHIAQASGAGLRFFSFYWYWNPANGGSENYVQGLKAFLQASNRANMDFSVTPCIHPWMDGNVSLRIPPEQIVKAANLIVDSYLTQPNYLRANDGRPIIGVCDARGLGNGSEQQIDTAATRQFTEAIRSRARAVLGEEVLIAFNGVPPPNTGLDGSQCLGQFDPSRSYQTYVSNQRSYFQSLPGVLMRCATSGFDERPRIGIGIGDPGSSPAALQQAFRWYADADLPKFKQLLANVRADIDQSTRPSTMDNFVLLYAWNEWHEGGYIEPNMRDGCAYLDAVRQQLSLTGGSGCVAQP